MAFLDGATVALDFITLWLVRPVLIVLLGVFLGKVLEQVLLFIGAEFAPGSRLAPLGAYAASWVVYLAAFALALSDVGILDVAATLLGALIAFVLGLHFVLAVIDVARNLAAVGVVRRRWRTGMDVDTKLVRGTVAYVGVISTRVTTRDGDFISVPNRTMRGFPPPKKKT
jgi:hypothetical protein